MNETTNETPNLISGNPNLISGNPNASENVTSDETSSVESTIDTSSLESTNSEATSSVEGMEWHPKEAIGVLPKAGVGMVVIFAIIGVIIVTTTLLSKITSKKKDK